MDTQEKIYAWKPIEGLASDYYVESLCNDKNGFRVILTPSENQTKRLLIAFPFGVRSYRATDELLSINAVPIETNSQPILEGWCLFKVINSEYLKWASKRSDNISDSLDLVHFGIYTTDWTIEILDHAEPQVTFIEND